MKTKLVGKSAKFQEILRTAELVAATDAPVLLAGAMGTGKKALAQRIHNKSNRKQRELVSVNCETLPEELADALLFGEKDSKKAGYIAQARSATLFLDAVSELSLSVQAKLLHFIENGEVRAVGDTISRKYDVRIISSSYKNLIEEVSAGNFRSDLFYCLNIVPIDLPELNKREGDVNLLIEYFFCELVRKQHQAAPSFTNAALKQIAQYNWPGNIRELQNFCERLFILFNGREVDITNLPQEIRNYTKSTRTSPFSLPTEGIHLKDVEIDLIQQALETSRGNKSRAARLLGLTRDTFLYRLKKHSINL